MRQIKYRGKATYNDEWRFGSFVIVEGSNHIVEECDLYECGHHIAQESDRPTWVKEETIGQYTGLRDKNGMEIYEGDIVRTKNGDVQHIVYQCGAWACYSSDGTWLNLFEEREPIREELTDMEVIGNIHDNPELLERR